MTEHASVKNRESVWVAGQALLLAGLVFLSRYFTRGGVYYVDGPWLVHCILIHTYVIQPPGYWLYARTAGMFPDPAFGLQFLNQIFSAAGVAVFFLLCRKLGLDRKMTWAASVCYASIYFVWLAGDVHSSYASQILFPPLLVYLFLEYRDRGSRSLLVACCACFAIGAGMRPSDGAFLVPLLAFLGLQFVHGWQRRALLVATTAVLCLLWYLPGSAAMHANQISYTETQDVARLMSVLVSGFTPRTIANMLRVVLGMFAAFWVLIPTLFLQREKFENRMLALWMVPGLLFFLLVYTADPVYYTYLTAAVILVAALSQSRKLALRLLIVCALWNASLFLFARPIRGNSRVDQAVNFYVLKYSEYGIRHQWMSTIGTGGVVP